MMTEPEVGTKKLFVPAILPWIIAAAAALLYLATLNRWISFNSLLQVAKESGWIWQPDIAGPVCWLLMYPLRWLPASLIPLGVNLFSMICAVLTLALLARSVTLLPHDRTQDQRDKADPEAVFLPTRIGWMPPILAVVVCGLQLTFWENATAGSGQAADLFLMPYGNHCEMLDLLLFAYVIRCLLEFRVTERDSWLFRASLVYGFAATQNWAMIGFLPVFVVVLIWLKGMSFFNGPFLGRATLGCVAGLSLYLFLPAVQSLSHLSPVPFWAGLKSELLQQKMALSQVYQYFAANKQETLLLALTSLLPIFIISIRWASSFGDNSPFGVWLTTFIFHTVHALFLGICIWVALDPSFSPRNKGYWVPCLTLSYLGALSVGYFAGYFLLIFGGPSAHRASWWLRLTRRCVTTVLWLLVLVVPALLVWRNLPQMRVTNGPMLRQYSLSQAQALPAGKTLVLSDDPRQLVLLQSSLASDPRAKDYLLLDASSLASPDYQRYLAKFYGPRWPLRVAKDMRQRLSDLDLISLLAKMQTSSSVYYLHPSFGYYFEAFDLEPRGVVYKLKSCPTNTLAAPALTRELVDENEAFWAKASSALAPLALAIAPPDPTNAPPFLRGLMQRLHLEPEANHDAMLLGIFYSRALDCWGVELQRQGELDKALAHFRLARELNPNNLSVELNMEVNRGLSTGHKEIFTSRSVEDKFGRYRRWEHILNDDGPFDDPFFCYQQGLVFTEGKLYRQAAHEFARVQDLEPDNLQARLMLAKMSLLRGLSPESLKVISTIHAQAQAVGLTRTNLPDVLLVEIAAHLRESDVSGAEAVMRSVLSQYPGDSEILATAARVYLNYGITSNAVSSIKAALERRPNDPRLLLMAAQVYLSARDLAGVDRSVQGALANSQEDDRFLALASQIYLSAGFYSNAVAVSERQIKLNPEDSQALVNKGYAWLRLGNFEQAIGPLTTAMDVDTNTTPTLRTYAQLNRAVAYLGKGDLDDARRDYEAVMRKYPSIYQVYYGLQDIAFRNKQPQDAARYCQLYLNYAPSNTDESKLVSARLKELRPGPR